MKQGKYLLRGYFCTQDEDDINAFHYKK